MESERLTFYEDLYLSRSDYTKTGTLPSRIYTNRDYQRIPSSWRTQSKPPRIRTQQPSPVATVKQAISPTPVAHSNSRSPNSTKNNHRRERLNSHSSTKGSTSPTDNPLYDHPPSPQPLAVMSNNRSDSNNNQRHRVNPTYAQLLPRTDNNSIYATLPIYHGRSASAVSSEHVYEIIPPRQQRLQSDPEAVRDRQRASRNQSPKTVKADQRSSNLRTMRRIAKSADNIRNLHHNTKLRNQSTLLAPYLWVRNDSPKLGTAASCNNISSPETNFGRLSHGFKSLDKENSMPETADQTDTILRQRLVSNSSRPPSRNRRLDSCEDTTSTSQRSSSSSLHSNGSRSPFPSQRRLAMSPSLHSSAGEYVNMNKLYSENMGDNNYVNFNIYEDDRELNYAELDLSKPPKTLQKSKGPKSKPSAQAPRGDDSVEYSVINIRATEAARKACEQQMRYRERRMATSS